MSLLDKERLRYALALLLGVFFGFLAGLNVHMTSPDTTKPIDIGKENGSCKYSR